MERVCKIHEYSLIPFGTRNYSVWVATICTFFVTYPSLLGLVAFTVAVWNGPFYIFWSLIK